VRGERLSSRKMLQVKCPKCGVVWERRFPYGCYDVFPYGGLPRYFCDNCIRHVEHVAYSEVRVCLNHGSMT